MGVPKEVKSALEILVKYCESFESLAACRGCGLIKLCGKIFAEMDMDKVILEELEDK